MAQHLDRVQLRRLWEQALAEDGADRDWTSQLTVDERASGTARLQARAAGVFAGEVMFELLREAYAGRITVISTMKDGQSFMPETIIASLEGPMRTLLGVERTLLNFLQRLCGVATLTRRYVDAIAGTEARIYDTRKTIPGWRQLDKYAVRCGGGFNHRMGLHDAILVKDNHLAGVTPQRLAGRISDLIVAAGAIDPPPLFIEVEVDSLEQLDELLKVSGFDIILLDNFSPGELREAVARREAAGAAGKVLLEASGGISLQSVRQAAETGVDRISVGDITHSAPALDISMEIVPIPSR